MNPKVCIISLADVQAIEDDKNRFPVFRCDHGSTGIAVCGASEALPIVSAPVEHGELRKLPLVDGVALVRIGLVIERVLFYAVSSLTRKGREVVEIVVASEDLVSRQASELRRQLIQTNRV